MYTLRLLGTPSLEGPDGPVAGRVAQKRKLALLAVLAGADGRTRTRDSLAAMFWPESPADRARHNVADSIWVIRRALGEEVLAAQGNRLTLSADMLATDVEAFQEALRQHDLRRAVDLYGGPFMDGFHISRAPEFEHWLDAQRAYLAADHGRALERLTGRALEDDRPADAAAWARRLAISEPLNSRYALFCMRAMAASGNVAGALRHGREHETLLRDELGIPPPPEIEAFAVRLRSPPSTAARKGPPHRAIPAANVPAPPNPPPPSSHRGTRALGAAVVLALLAWLIPRDAGDPSPSLVSDRIVVLPFENRTGDPALDRLGQLTADVLLRGLAETEVGDVVLAQEMVGEKNGMEEGESGRSRAGRVAATFQAGISVTGTLDRDGDSTVLRARISTDGGSRLAAALAPVRVDPDRPGPALERLSSRVAGSVAAHLGEELPEHPYVVRTPSYESYRAADRATSLFLQQRYDTAAAAFRRAYRLDTTAVGYLLWEAISYENLDERRRTWAILDELRPRRDELSPFDAAQFDWLEAMALGDRPEALRATRRAHEHHPHSGMGGFQLGMELTRSGRYEEALDVLLALNPDRGWLARFQFYWNRLAVAYHHLGRHEEELAAAEEGYARHPTGTLLRARIRALAALGRIPELRRALRESTYPPGQAVGAARALHRHDHDSVAVVVATESLRELAATPLPLDASQSDSMARRNTEIRLLMAAGRYAEARALLAELLENDPTHRDLLGWMGFLEARLGLEDAARRRIDALRSLGQAPFTNGGHTVARAAIHAELGDDPALVRLLLEQSHQQGWPLDYFHFTLLFDPVREHPEVRDFFQATAGLTESRHARGGSGPRKARGFGARAQTNGQTWPGGGVFPGLLGLEGLSILPKRSR